MIETDKLTANDKLNEAYDNAFKNPGESFHIGKVVVCDSCGVDWTEKPDSGGLIFSSKGICPTCEPAWNESIKKYGEEQFVKAICPEGVSFADFVRKFRGPDAAITVYR